MCVGALEPNPNPQETSISGCEAGGGANNPAADVPAGANDAPESAFEGAALAGEHNSGEAAGSGAADGVSGAAMAGGGSASGPGKEAECLDAVGVGNALELLEDGWFSAN